MGERRNIYGVKMLYLVQTRIATGTNISKREFLDDKTEKITRKFSPEERDKIKNIRTRHISIIRSKCFNFFGLWVCRQEDVGKIRKELVEVERELKEVAPDLTAEGVFLPLPMDKGGSTHEALISSIRHHVFSTLIKKLQMISERSQLEITEASHKNIVAICDELATSNLLNDEKIARVLNEVKNKVSNDFRATIADMQKEVEISEGKLNEFQKLEDAPVLIPPIVIPSKPKVEEGGIHVV